MEPIFLAEYIAVIGVCIFAALFYLAFFRKEVFQNDESKSLKAQIVYLLAAVFGLFLVRDEFATVWGDTRFSYSVGYLYFSLANIPAIILYVAFLRRRKLPEDRGMSRPVREKEAERKRKVGRKRKAKRKGDKHRKPPVPAKRERGKEEIEKTEKRDTREEERESKGEKEEEKSLVEQAQNILDL